MELEEELVGRLERFGATMRECLAALDAAPPDGPLDARSFRELEERFAALGDLTSLVRAAPRGRCARLRELGAELVRLHAVLRAAVAHDRERCLAELERARRARRSCRAVPPDGGTGGACDLSA